MQKDIRQLAAVFGAPGNEWRAKPFWSWNGELEAGELLRQVHIIKEMGWGGHFMHARAGLATEYLGEEWFRLINLVADESERLGLESWLYDEDRWPSGSAGGKVTADGRYRMKSLTLTETALADCAPQPGDLALWLVYLGEDALSLWYAAPLTDPSQAPAVMAAHPQTRPGRWRLARFWVEEDACSSNYNGATYLDTMNADATRRFLRLTHEEYKRHCKDRLGRSIRGIFTDEPHRGHGLDDLREKDGVRSCRIAWTDDFFAQFAARYGYDPLAHLPELFYAPQGATTAAVRRDWFDLADDLFVERFAAPIDDWCRQNGLVFTGHVLHEDSLTNQSVPHGSLMRFYEHMGAPGVDVLTEGNRCWWIVKQLASAARQTGKTWLLSELYGCTGWQFDFAGHKAVGDWQALFGINLRCPHLSWYTMEGQAKRDYPASLLHQSPWYRDYPLVEDHFARFGVLMTAAPLCDVLVLHPIESAWLLAHIGWAKWITCNDENVARLEQAYAQLFDFLTGDHIDFDYGEEEMLGRLAAVEYDAAGRPLLRVGKMRYRVVVVGGLLTLRAGTLALLGRFAAAGGSVIFAGEAPTLLDGRPSEAPAALADACRRTPFAAAELTRAVRAAAPQPLQLAGPDGCVAKDVFVQLRRHGERLYCAVALNTDREAPRQGLTLTVTLPQAARLHPQVWDLDSGARYDAAGICRRDGDSLRLAFSLPGGGSMAFVFAAQEEQLPPLPNLRPLPWPKETRVRADGAAPAGFADLAADPACINATADQKTADPADGATPKAAAVNDPRAMDAFTGPFAAGPADSLLVLPDGPYPYTLEEENVCVLDFVRWRFAPGTDAIPAHQPWQGPLEVLKADDALRDALGLERRGGEMLQPWFAKLHHAEEYGTLQLAYTFTVETLPDGPVTLAAERPEKMHYALNGVPLTPDGGFWVDICFKRLPIPAGALRLGQNVLTATTTFTRATNPEAVYLLGGFGVHVQGHAAALTALPPTLRFGSLVEQGLPFYTGGLCYRLSAQPAPWQAAAAALARYPQARLQLAVGRFHGALVRVNTPAGCTRLGWQPYTADVTDAVRAGQPVSLTLVGTRRNTFGPLHLQPALDVAYGPEHFKTEGERWNDDYVFVESGLAGAALQLTQPADTPPED